MSGGVGPYSDIGLPKEQQKPKHTSSSGGGGGGGFLTFSQLNALAITVILAASGMVSPEDFAFVLFFSVYMFFISKVAFPARSPSKTESVFSPKSKLLALYTFLGTLVGLIFPVIYIFEGMLEGDKEGIQAASPHVFLLASQVLLEGLVSSRMFSIPVRVFVPVLYNSRRIFTIIDWLKVEYLSKGDRKFSGSSRRLCVGRALAIANMAYWSFNIFGFLLPVYLPKAFKKYYSAQEVKGD